VSSIKRETVRLLIESILEPKGWPAGEGAGVLNFKLQRQELPTPKKILIIQLTSIGDVVMTTPVIEGLREKYPEAYIAFLLDEPSLDVVKGNPFLDEVILFDEYRYFREIKTRQKTTSEIEDELANFIEGLSSRNFNLVMNFHLSKRAAIITRLIEAENFLGLNIDKDGELFLRGNLWIYYIYLRMFVKRRREVPGRLLHQGELNLRLAGLSPGRFKTHIEIGEEGQKEGGKFLTSNGVEEEEHLIGLNPGANWLSKRWPWQKFAQLGDELHKEYGARIVIFGGVDDVKLGKKITEAMQTKPIDATGKLSLKGLAYVLSKCCLFITNDTGPMHIAGAVGTPVISISGPVFGGPYDRRGHIILHQDLDCIECGKTGCKDHRCMEEIEVRDILTAVKISLCGGIPSENDGTKYYYSGMGRSPESPFSYTPYHPSTEELCERILNLAYLKYWEYLNLQLTETGREIIPIEDITPYLTSSLQPMKNKKKKSEVSLRVEEEMSKFTELEDLCSHGEELAQRLHSLVKFGVKGPNSEDKEEKEMEELLARLYLLDKKIEGVGSAGRFLKFLGLLGRESSSLEDKKTRIITNSFQDYHTKREACIYLQGVLRKILKNFKRSIIFI